MTFSDQFLDEVRARNDIVDVVSRYTSLARRGSGYVGLCPFHNEKTPSFSVSQDRQFFHCFGCGVGGDVISFLMKIENLDFPDAVTQLAERAGLPLPAVDEHTQQSRKRRERALALHTEAARYFHAQLHSAAGREALSYLTGRGLSAATITRFGLGFAPPGWDGLISAMAQLSFTKQELLDAGLAVSGKNGGIYDRFRNRVMFPIIDVRGAVIGFGGRVMDDSTPKYLNSPETALFNKRRNLFALNLAKKSSAEAMILAEGYMDVIALHQAGFDSAVASLGTSLTEEQVKLISRYKKQVVIAYDSDTAGVRAATRAIELLRPAGVSVRVLRMKDAKDPDEYIKKFGREQIVRLLQQSEADCEYKLSSVRAKHELSTDEGRVAYLREAVGVLAGIMSPVEREIYIARVAKDAGVSAQAVTLEVGRAHKKEMRRREREESHKNLAPVSAIQPKERAMRFDNPRSAVAEEGVLAALVVRNDWIDPVAEQLSAEDFSSPMLAEIYQEILRQHQDGREVGAAGVLGALSPEAASHFTGVLARAGEPKSDALRDYLKTIEVERAKGSEDALRAAAKLYREKKSYGG